MIKIVFWNTEHLSRSIARRANDAFLASVTAHNTSLMAASRRVGHARTRPLTRLKVKEARVKGRIAADRREVMAEAAHFIA